MSSPNAIMSLRKLSLVAGVGVDVAHAISSGAEFGDAIHQKGDGFAEFLFDIFEAKIGVFDGVVKNAGDDGIFVHAPFLKDFFDC